MQSFYIGLTGTLNGKRLYFDLLSDYINSEYDFKFAINNDELPKHNKERDNTNNTVSDCLWWTVDNLFQRLSTTNKAREVAKEIIKKANIDDSIKIDIIETNVQDFLMLFLRTKVLESQKFQLTRIRMLWKTDNVLWNCLAIE